jgi:hypothetical protein
MYRLFVFSRLLSVAALVVSLAVVDASASHPDILRNYRFIPSRSTLEVTGGFAGIEQTYHARGTFGLVTGFEEGVTCAAIGCPPPPHIPFAEFVDVDAWLHPDGPLTYVLNLDETLNLSGLDGTFSTSSPERLHFRGLEGQGWPFRLTAVRHGRLLHLFGENEEGCCDFFHYKFNAIAYQTPYADANLDGTVDAADYVAMRKSIDPAVTEGGSGSSSDLDLWLASFGDSIDFDAIMAEATSASAVPEPATIGLLMIGAWASTGGRRRRAANIHAHADSMSIM